MIPLRDLNPTRTTPLITSMLIVLNVLVFLYEVSLPQRQLQQLILAYGVIPYELSHSVDVPPLIGVPIYLTIFSSMFMHGGWLHLIGNMLYLWIFGNNIEDRFGHLRFLGIYLLWGILAAVAQVAIEPLGRIPAVGASGAVAGVLGAYLMIFPQARVDALVPIGIFATSVRLPAWLIIGQWLVIQLFSGFASLGVEASRGGVAYFAHIGGALAGLAIGALYRVLNRNRSRDDFYWMER